MNDLASIPPRSVKVEIPEELASYVLDKTEVCGRYLTKRKKGNNTHPLMKIMGFYLLLKAESPGSSLIQNYTKQIPTLCASFSLSRRSFYYHLGALERLKLITKDLDGNLRIASWQQLGNILSINTKQRTQIEFYYDGKQKIHWWFAAIDIKSNQETQEYMIWKKVNKNSEAKNELLTAMHARGFDVSNADNPGLFAAALFSLYVEDFRTGTEVHDILIHIRSDVNRSCKKLANDWSMSAQLTSYWKKIMHKQQIIDVTKMQVVSQWSRETNDCHKNKFCHVIWNDKLKERVWFLCDQVTVIMPWKWQEFLEKNRPGTVASYA